MARKWIATLTVVASIFGAVQVSSSTELCHGFLPENNLKIPVGDKSAAGISEAEFNGVMDRMEKLYTADLQRMGGKLKINRLWSNATVNASATRNGNTWVLNMYGGLARHRATNVEGMALVACHEMGHHIGGAPKISGWFNSWASNEGASDYFAALKCLRRYFAEDDNKAILANAQIDPTAQAGCMQQFSQEIDQLICMRTSMAGESVANLFKDLSKDPVAPKYNTPDTSRVSTTDDSHPATQCRMDTYFAGMLCPVSINSNLDDNDYRAGSCYAPRDKVGFRPACWFAAN